MSAKFGTSGLRGLVTELTEDVVTSHVQAFLRACGHGGQLFVGQDLRPSSPELAQVIHNAAAAVGVLTIDCGALPTPALALAAMGAGASAIMVTGSHIPADRNGLKFYTPTGEITKSDEDAIVNALQEPVFGTRDNNANVSSDAAAAYVSRYTDAFGADALSGLKLGVYMHSAVGRDLLVLVLRSLGAAVTEIERSDSFIPVDTEAVAPELRRKLPGWTTTLGLDAVVSTDGDSDRPLVADEQGTIVPGDVIGQICAAELAAEVVATPVSSNSGLELSKRHDTTFRTRIGSPYVIATMNEASNRRTIGYEANGGFLLGFDWVSPTGAVLPRLPTRDAFLPILLPLVAAKREGISLSARVAQEPQRFAKSDRLQNVETALSAEFVYQLSNDKKARDAYLGTSFEISEINTTDGLRMIGSDGRIVHIRPSGNAPELRLYVEARSEPDAVNLLENELSKLDRIFFG